MMKVAAIGKSAALALLGFTLVAAANPKDTMEVEGPNVRVLRHADGSTTRFTRAPDNRTLTKRKLNASGVLTMLTIYRMDARGNPVSCQIFDGNGQKLFKVSYGYRKQDGQLVEERMFDARVVRRDPKSGNEMPIQRICYTFDAQGNRSAPIVINLLPGKSFEEVFGLKSSALETNPFLENGSGSRPPGR